MLTTRGGLHEYTSSGTYRILLIVTDDEGNTVKRHTQVHFDATQPPDDPSPNQPPEAQVTASRQVAKVGQDITFDGSGSTDPDGEVRSYRWDFGDGTSSAGVSASGTGEQAASVDHSFDSAGEKTVTLTVMDDQGAVDSAQVTVSVLTVDIFARQPIGVEPHETDVVARVSGSAGGQIRYQFDCRNDGSFENSFNTGNTQESVRCRYDTAGDYTARVKVTRDGLFFAGTVAITVQEEQQDPPTARFSFNPGSPQVGDSVTFDGGNSSDPDGTIDRYEWRVDGSQFATGRTTSRTFNSAGSFTVTLKVTDNDGLSDSTSKTVTVAEEPNEPPNALINFEVNDDCVDFDGTNSSDPDGRIEQYEWDFGDGSTGTGATVTHCFDPGSYRVSLTVTDDDGATDTDRTGRIDIEEDQQAPTARFSFNPGSPQVGDSVTFDGGNSSDPDGTIDRYEWRVDGSQFATGRTTSRTFNSAGSFTVTLKVTDNDGLSDSTSKTVRVEEGDRFDGLTIEPNPDSVSTGESVGVHIEIDGKSGTQIEYKLKCREDEDWRVQQSGTLPLERTFDDLCSYSQEGTFTIHGRAEAVNTDDTVNGTATINVVER